MSKYQTREEKLTNKIKEELTHPTPNADRIVEYVNEFEQANLDTIEKLNRVKKLDDNKIKGALRQTINAHGPITLEYIGSATKRINGAIMLEKSAIQTQQEPVSDIFSIRGILLGMAIMGIICTILCLVT